MSHVGQLFSIYLHKVASDGRDCASRGMLATTRAGKGTSAIELSAKGSEALLRFLKSRNLTKPCTVSLLRSH